MRIKHYANVCHTIQIHVTHYTTACQTLYKCLSNTIQIHVKHYTNACQTLYKCTSNTINASNNNLLIKLLVIADEGPTGMRMLVVVGRDEGPESLVGPQEAPLLLQLGRFGHRNVDPNAGQPVGHQREAQHEQRQHHRRVLAVPVHLLQQPGQSQQADQLQHADTAPTHFLKYNHHHSIIRIIIIIQLIFIQLSGLLSINYLDNRYSIFCVVVIQLSGSL